MQTLLRHRFPILLALALAVVFLARPAAALTPDEAGRVVLVLETLQPDYGTLAYDEAIADDWYERDSRDRRFIAAQGFDRARWKQALDATMRGYLATVPQAEIDALFAQMRARLGQAPRMSAEQRRTMNEWVDEQQADLARLRTEGAPDAVAVKPHVERLRRLLPAAIPAD